MAPLTLKNQQLNLFKATTAAQTLATSKATACHTLKTKQHVCKKLKDAFLRLRLGEQKLK